MVTDSAKRTPWWIGFRTNGPRKIVHICPRAHFAQYRRKQDVKEAIRAKKVAFKAVLQNNSLPDLQYR